MPPLLYIHPNASTGWQRPTGCLIFMGHFPQKSPKISGSFAKNDLQLKVSYGSSPLCNSNKWPVLCNIDLLCSSDLLWTPYRSQWATGWRRPIGCLKLQVIFCKRYTNYRAVLRKMTCEGKASCASWPPCSYSTTLWNHATHCNTLQHTATRCNTLQHTATHCNTLQHTATHCNTLQHSTTLWNDATSYLLWNNANHRSLLQNIVSFTGLFCRRDL